MSHSLGCVLQGRKGVEKAPNLSSLGIADIAQPLFLFSQPPSVSLSVDSQIFGEKTAARDLKYLVLYEDYFDDAVIIR